MKYKPHKIAGIELTTCNCEMKIAYNYLFSTYKSPRIWAVDFVKKDIERNEKMKRYDKQLIVDYFCGAFNQYQDNFFIACSYEDIKHFFVDVCGAFELDKPGVAI